MCAERLRLLSDHITLTDNVRLLGEALASLVYWNEGQKEIKKLSDQKQHQNMRNGER